MPNQELDSRGRVSGDTSNYKKRRFGRPKKRKNEFYTKKDEEAPPEKKCKPSTSSKKIQNIGLECSDIKNRIIDISILFIELEKFLCCSKCKEKVQFSESDIRGLGFNIKVQCSKCSEKISISSSKKVGSMRNALEVNRRSVLASRALGHGHAGLATFCGIMDLPSPVVHSTFDLINEQLSKACEKVANSIMIDAVTEEIAATPSSSPGLDVSGDGSWRKRGFSSLQGISSIIGQHTNKVIDVSIKNSFCKSCTLWEGKDQSTAQYTEWFDDHKNHCSSNHEGSAGKMEVDGILEMFLRSEEKYQVKYQNYIGDGDSKVFSAVSQAKPYGDELVVKKKECVGHVQKRMGTRLRELKKKLGRTLLSDGKSIGGRGRLTAQVIDQLTVFYGNAIRAHSDSEEDIANAIWATYYHKLSTDQEPQHHFCPQGVSSWCKWQVAKAQGNEKSFKHKNSIPKPIMDAIKSIYVDLTKKELLERCVGGYTQNSNESFNNSVWKLVPKTSFSGLTVFSIGVYIAIACFNNGYSGFLNTMQEFDVHPGASAVQWAKTSNDSRLFHAARKVVANTKEARQQRRQVRLQLPNEYYSAGAF